MHKYIALILTWLLHYDIIHLQLKANEMIAFILAIVYINDFDLCKIKFESEELNFEEP